MKTPVIGIIGGKGHMGRLFADFFQNRGITVLISDKNTKLKNIDLVKKCDITIVSTPIDVTSVVINEIIPHIPANSALMDLTSVKEMPIKAMLKADCEVLGLHPMFGSGNPINGQTIIICPTKKSDVWSQWIEQFFDKQGVNIIKMPAKEHDKIMNIAQGLIHFAEIAFSDSVRRMKIPVNELLQYTGKASELKLQLAARLIEQDAGLYANIQILNPHALKSLKEFKKSVDELFKIVKKKNTKAFEKYFQKNKEFYGDYTKTAYKESSYLIDRLMAMRGLNKKSNQSPPTYKHLAILGPKNTFSDMAATQYLHLLEPQNAHTKKYFARDIEEVFDLVESGKVKEGILPVENKLNGTIRETLDGLFARNVHITAEISLPIHHSLITLSHAKKSDIKKIISHSQPLSQCKKYLKKNFLKTEKESFSSTGAAIEELLRLNDNSIAAIAPSIAANRPELKIIESNVEDSGDNSTSFVVIRKGRALNDGKKTSIAFYFNQDKPGSLLSIFQDFATAKINLTKIESRPTKANFGDYIFYLDFAGSLKDAKVQNILKKVESKVAKLKVLGNY